MKGYVFYKDRWLAPNSEGFALYQRKEWMKLDALIVLVDRAYKKLSGS